MVGALSFTHGVALPMEVLAVLNMVNLSDELFFDSIACVQAVKRLANHHLQVVVCLLNLTDVNLLKLYRNRFKSGAHSISANLLTSTICVNQFSTISV